jgi:chromosome segregation ATPase
MADQGHRHERLKAAKKRLSSAETTLTRLQGRLQAAQEERQRVEEECRAKGVPPEKLDEAIATLEKRYDEKMADLETQIDGAESKLAPYLEESR